MEQVSPSYRHHSLWCCDGWPLSIAHPPQECGALAKDPPGGIRGFVPCFLDIYRSTPVDLTISFHHSSLYLYIYTYLYIYISIHHTYLHISIYIHTYLSIHIYIYIYYILQGYITHSLSYSPHLPWISMAFHGGPISCRTLSTSCLQHHWAASGRASRRSSSRQRGSETSPELPGPQEKGTSCSDGVKKKMWGEEFGWWIG